MLIHKVLADFMACLMFCSLALFVPMPHLAAAAALNNNALAEKSKTKQVSDIKTQTETLNIAKARKEKIILLHTMVEQGHALAQFELGNLHYYGWWGVKTDREKGISYYEQSAKKGNAQAQYALGVIYAGYKNVLKDYKKAKYWLEKAAGQGDARAQCLLGEMYQAFLIMDAQGFQKAKYWLEKAAKQGNVRAMHRLRAGHFDKSLALTLAELEEVNNARKEEMRLLHIKAEQGDILAQFELGARYDYTRNNQKKALHWFEKAAEQDHAEAMYRLSQMYSSGSRVVKKDIFKGMDYLEQAAKKDHVDSQFRLGFIYFNGNKDVKQDFPKAAKYFEQAARQGHANSQYNLGVMYAEGKGLTKDLEKAEYYIEKSGRDYGSYTNMKADDLKKKEKAE